MTTFVEKLALHYNAEQTCTRECGSGVKGNKARTISDDAGGKGVSEKTKYHNENKRSTSEPRFIKMTIFTKF